MTIIPVPQDSTSVPYSGATAYDSVWANTGVPSQEPVGLERTMLAEDKLYVVLAVVLIIWMGILYFIFRTDRKLAGLERTVGKDILHETSDA